MSQYQPKSTREVSRLKTPVVFTGSFPGPYTGFIQRKKYCKIEGKIWYHHKVHKLDQSFEDLWAHTLLFQQDYVHCRSGLPSTISRLCNCDNVCALCDGTTFFPRFCNDIALASAKLAAWRHRCFRLSDIIHSAYFLTLAESYGIVHCAFIYLDECTINLDECTSNHQGYHKLKNSHNYKILN